MILYSLESLWNYLQDSAKEHLIWISFEHRLNRCLSKGPVQGHRKNRCYWFLHNSSNSAFLWVLSSCFTLLTLFNTFLKPKRIHLTNLLVSLIALSYDHQNHSKWHKWCHVRYTLCSWKLMACPSNIFAFLRFQISQAAIMKISMK